MTLDQMLLDLPVEERLKIERRFWELVLEAHNARESNARNEEAPYSGCMLSGDMEWTEGWRCGQCRGFNDPRNGSCTFCRANRPGVEAYAERSRSGLSTGAQPMIPTDEIRELCERLRDRDNTEDEFALCLEAAETIASLSERIRELEEAISGYLAARDALEQAPTSNNRVFDAAHAAFTEAREKLRATLTQADERESGRG